MSRMPVILLVLLLLAPTAALAGGFSTNDFGCRRHGMAAVVARPDDVTALFHNPAGLVLRHGHFFQFSMATFIVTPGIRMYDSEGVLHPNHEISPDWTVAGSPFFGFATDLNTKKLRLAFAAFLPNGFGADLPENEPSRYHSLQTWFVASRATAAAAYEVSDRFAVGATVSVIHAYIKAKRFVNTSVFSDPDNRFLPASETVEGDHLLEMDGQDFTWAVDLGVLFKPLDTLRIGASFAGGSAAELEGDVELKYTTGELETTRHLTEIVIPFTLRAGVNWEATDRFEMGFDVRYWHYQVFQEQRSVLDEPLLNGLLSELSAAKNYGNSWNIGLGVMHHTTDDLDFMVGFKKDYTPIPNQTLTLENPSRNSHSLSGGVRWQCDDNIRLGMSLVKGWIDLANVQNSLTVPPTNIKARGGTLTVGLDLLYQL